MLDVMLPSRLFEQSKAGLIEGATVTQHHQLSQPVSSRLLSTSVAGNTMQCELLLELVRSHTDGSLRPRGSPESRRGHCGHCLKLLACKCNTVLNCLCVHRSTKRGSNRSALVRSRLLTSTVGNSLV